MWLYVLLCLAVLAGGVYWFFFCPPPHAITVVRVQSGSVRVERGRLLPHAREHLTQILSQAGVVRGYIAVTPNQRILFSRGIPSTVHQRLRNVLLNQ